MNKREGHAPLFPTKGENLVLEFLIIFLDTIGLILISLQLNIVIHFLIVYFDVKRLVRKYDEKDEISNKDILDFVRSQSWDNIIKVSPFHGKAYRLTYMMHAWVWDRLLFRK